MKRCAYSVLIAVVFLTSATITVAQNSPVDETKIIAEQEQVSESESATVETKGPSTAERLQRDHQDLLAKAEVGPKALWLKSEHEFLAFWQEDLSGSPKGALLLLPDSDHHPVWPETLLNLHEYLPQFGWATLSISLLTPPAPAVPPRPMPLIPAPTAAAGNNGTSAQPTEDKPVDETQVVHQEQGNTSAATTSEITEQGMDQTAVLQENHQRIQQAITHLQSQGQYNIVLLGLGRGAYSALQFLHTQKLPTPTVAEGQNPRKKAIVDRAIRALVTVDLHNHYPHEQISADSFMHMPEIPHMDIATEISLETAEEMQQRKLISRQRQYELYRQKQLTPAKGVVYSSKETELTRTIRGFLQRYAAGQEL